MLLVDAVRAASARVAASASVVDIDDDGVARCCETLTPPDPDTSDPWVHVLESSREERAAFFFVLDAINFGSGWWPTLRKRPGRSGFFTIAAGIAERFARAGPWSAAELARISPVELAGVLGQDAEHELMALYAHGLRDVGERMATEFGGSFAAVVDAAEGSAPRLVEIVASWPSFLDVSVYLGRSVPFFKRAQLLAADLERAGVARFDGLERLTLFADNLVPHVLRVDGVLRYDPKLAARIDAGDLLEHGSQEEVELRACAVEAVERIAERSRLPAAEVDLRLWTRGQLPRYKSRPRHRARCTAY